MKNSIKIYTTHPSIIYKKIIFPQHYQTIKNFKYFYKNSFIFCFKFLSNYYRDTLMSLEQIGTLPSKKNMRTYSLKHKTALKALKALKGSHN